MQWNHRLATASAAARSTRPSPASCCRNMTPRPASWSARSRTSSPAATTAWSKAPHLFKRNGWYYLTTAEGGTGYDHAVTMARSRDDRRSLRAASGHPSDHLEGCARTPRCSAPAMARSSRRRTARSITRISARGRCPACGARRSAARRRSRNASGATTAGSTSPAAARCRPSRSSARRCREDRAAAGRPLRFRQAATCRRFPVAAHAVAGAHLLADASRPGALRLHRPRIDRQLVRAGAGRAPAGAFLAPRRDRGRVRAGHLPAGGRADALLQPPQVPFPGGQPRRAARPRADHHVLSGRLARRQAGVPAGRADRSAGDGPVGLAAEIDGAHAAVLLSHGGRLAAGRPGARRQRDLRRRRARRARLVHRRLRRHGRLRHQRRGAAGRFRYFEYEHRG